MCGPLALLAVGCTAGMNVRRVVDDNTESGIRYYQSAPYLLVQTDNDGGVTTKVLYFPELGRLMAVHPYNRGASLKMKLAFKNGVLASADSSADESTLPAAIVDSLKGAATAALSAKFAAERPGGTKATVPTPYLFKIVISEKDVKLVGGQPIDLKGAAVPTIEVDAAGEGQP